MSWRDRLPQARGRLLFDEALAPFTWLRVGGPADVIFLPEDEADLAGFLRVLDPGVPVTATVQTTTTVVTVPGNQAPTISFLSLTRAGLKLYARFRTCDDSGGGVKVTERDKKAGALSYTRHFAVSCGTYSRSWTLINRFRSPGRLVVTLRASDTSGKLSRLVSRSVTIH